MQATNGNFYGTTELGGVGYGTVFEIISSSKGFTFKPLHSFDAATDGGYPFGTLVQATNGDLYGTASVGGTSGAGTVFKITPGGVFEVFGNLDYTDGADPIGGLVQAADGNFYGTASGGGGENVGTVFEITSGGTLTMLYSFCSVTNCTDGNGPHAGLVQATDGNFYGTTYAGGTPGEGTVFSLSKGLGPFVETHPTSGKVGAKVRILGTDLTGATSVTFNGTAATFTVVSKSEITTTVPTGATTGKVKVVTPSRTLSSNVSFQVP